MTDYKLANLIIQRYNEQKDHKESLFIVLKERYWFDLSDIFTWDKSPEGGNFWYGIHKKFINNNINLHNFLLQNILYNKKFISLKSFI